jgi:CBS domain-containing protein
MTRRDLEPAVVAWSMVRIPRALAEIPETEQIMTETSAQQPSVPSPAAPASVAGIMRSAVTTIDRNDHVAAAAYLMRRKGVTALVLVNAETKRPVGLITEADLVQLMADGRDPDEVRIHELMATRLSVIKATESIRDAANTMITGRFRHLPVVDDAGLVGIVDITDICRALLDAL